MPNTKSAKKSWRKNLEAREKNRSVKSELRGRMRKVREAAATGNLEQGATEFRTLTKKLDQAAAKNVIHKNMASRIKGRLSATLKHAKTQPAPAPAAPAKKK
ncbi:MAG TPA: 30S ribosomal protein S20 [Pirellulales bacterium]|nr:30S ribosomal protein S20 [Pirellulales bacterium]